MGRYFGTRMDLDHGCDQTRHPERSSPERAIIKKDARHPERSEGSPDIQEMSRKLDMTYVFGRSLRRGISLIWQEIPHYVRNDVVTTAVKAPE
jgi:hypothetical protein